MKTLKMHRWLLKHGYKLSRKPSGRWLVSDPLDDSQGWKLRGTYSEVVRESYEHLSTI